MNGKIEENTVEAEYDGLSEDAATAARALFESMIPPVIAVSADARSIGAEAAFKIWKGDRRLHPDAEEGWFAALEWERNRPMTIST